MEDGRREQRKCVSMEKLIDHVFSSFHIPSILLLDESSDMDVDVKTDRQTDRPS